MNIRETIIARLDKVKYVSFDIFDTLLLRTTRFPWQIFEKTWEKAPWLFPAYLDACEWKELRRFAETCARERKQGKEVTLEEIYGELPKIIENRNQIMETEIAMEEENTYINPAMGEILTELEASFGKKLILISDMYLCQKDILRILAKHGLDASMFSRILYRRNMEKENVTEAYMTGCANAWIAVRMKSCILAIAGTEIIERLRRKE